MALTADPHPDKGCGGVTVKAAWSGGGQRTQVGTPRLQLARGDEWLRGRLLAPHETLTDPMSQIEKRRS